jgi:hypothetical protein
LREVALLNTGAQRLVELLVKDGLSAGGGLVVGEDVLLQRLAAVGSVHVSQNAHRTDRPNHADEVACGGEI